MVNLQPTLPWTLARPVSPANRARVIGGWLALLGAIILVLVTAPGWLRLALAALATIGIAGDRRFGWLGAGAAVTLAMPFGVSAAANPVTVGAIPLNSQDLAIGLAVLGMLPAVRWPPPRRGRVLVLAVAVFMALGLAGLVVGVLDGNAPRDIARDVRWWILYLVPAVAVLARVSWKSVVRGFAVGVTVFAALVVVTPLLPRFTGGLKDAVLVYMTGALRMQMSNSVFLTAAAILAAWLVLRRPTPGRVAWLWVVATAQFMSLTRTAILVLVVALVVLVISQWLATRPERRPVLLRRTGLLVSVPVVALIVGVGLVTYASSPDANGSNGVSRITFSDPSSDLGAIGDSATTGGRFATYISAFREIAAAPVLGPGLGELVHVAFAYNDLRAHTLHQQPGVDDAFLTVGLKAGGLGIAAFGLLVLLPLLRAPPLRLIRGWYPIAWGALLVVMVTQSFAVSGYGPFGVALLLAVPFLVPAPCQPLRWLFARSSVPPSPRGSPASRA